MQPATSSVTTAGPGGTHRVIRLTDGEELRITVPVLEEDIVDISEVWGVPVSGRIDLGVLEVQTDGPGG